jgi:hypothetical protein
MNVMLKSELEAPILVEKSFRRSLLYLVIAVVFALSSNVINSEKDKTINLDKQTVNSFNNSHNAVSETLIRDL